MPVPSEPGIRPCNRCRIKFVSPDPCRVRTCSKCTRGDDGKAPRVYKSYMGGSHYDKRPEN